jgi:hypothetical protein
MVDGRKYVIFNTIYNKRMNLTKKTFLKYHRIVSRLRAGQVGIHNTTGPRYFFFSSSSRPAVRGHAASFSMTTGVLSRVGVDQPGYDFGHSPPLSVEVKNEWNCLSTPPVGVAHEDNRHISLTHMWAAYCHAENKVSLSLGLESRF